MIFVPSLGSTPPLKNSTTFCKKSHFGGLNSDFDMLETSCGVDASQNNCDFNVGTLYFPACFQDELSNQIQG